MRALLLFQLRTGWKGLAGWALAWTCLVLAVAASTLSLYPGGEERERYAASLGASRMQEAFNGRGYELRTAGGILSVEVGMFGLLALSLGACLMAVGRTRPGGQLVDIGASGQSEGDMGPAKSLRLRTGNDVGATHELEPGAAPASGIGIEADDERAQARPRVVVLAVRAAGEPTEVEVAYADEIGHP